MIGKIVRTALLIGMALVLAACELGGESGESGDVAALREQLAGKDAQIASLQAQVAAQGGQPAAAPETGGRLARVKERGRLTCAAPNDVPGLGYLDSEGRNLGFDVDLCRAVAAAIFGNGEAVEIVSVAWSERSSALQGRRSGSDVHDHDVDHHARLAVGQLHCHYVLRRPGLHDPEGQGHRECVEAGRHDHLRDQWDDDRTEPGGFPPAAQFAGGDGRLRRQLGGGQRLCTGTLRRCHER